MIDPTTRLQRWLRPLGRDLPPLYMVGGAVRDYLLGRPNKDIDLMCPDPEAVARRLGRIHHAAVVPFVRKADAPCYRVVDRGDPRDFLDLVGIAGGSVAVDLARRDFTINAMALPILAGGGFGPLFDPLGGRHDLAEGRIRVCGSDAFRSDPLRILRAVRIAAQLAFTVDRGTLDMARRCADGLAAVAVERSVMELFELFQHPASAVHVKTLDHLGALAPVLPEIAALKGCVQNAYHHLDVWDHSLAVLEHLEALLGHPEASFGAAAGAVADLLAADGRLAVLKLACLLHDAGKPVCRVATRENGPAVFRGHAQTGAALAEASARRLKLSARDRDRLVLLVGRHMQASAWAKPEVRPGTVVKWCRRLGDEIVLLICLSMADALAKRGPASDEGKRRRHLQWGRETLEDYFGKIVPAMAARPLITGRDVLALGLEPGPRIGRVLERVRVAQDAGEVTSRDAALEMVRNDSQPFKTGNKAR